LPASRPERLRSNGITLVVSTRSRSSSLAKILRHYVARSGLTAAQIEVLVFINPGTQGLSTLYNQALQQAAFDVVCFLHDDLHFLRGARWGEQVLRAFQSTDFAALSAAGSVSLDETGIFWAQREHLVGRVRHRLPFSPSPARRTYFSSYSEAFDRPLPVLVLDGLFLALHRQRLDQFQPFDERFTFHFYDLAFSLRQSLARSGSCGVLTQLRVVHHSLGQPNANYWHLRECFVKHYGQVLPQFLVPHPLPLQTDNPEPVPAKLHNLSAEAPLLHTYPLQSLVQRAQEDTDWLDHIAPEDGVWIYDTGLDLRDASAMGQRLWGQFLRSQNCYGAFKPGLLAPRLHYADTRLLYHNGLTFSAEGLVHRGMHQAYAYRLKDASVDAVMACAVLVRGDVFCETLGRSCADDKRFSQDPALAWGLQLSAQAHQQGLQVKVSGLTWGLWSDETWRRSGQ
jgi:hypothetical protein